MQTERSFAVRSTIARDAIELELAVQTLDRWISDRSPQRVSLPLGANREAVLELTPFSVTTPQTRFDVIGSQGTAASSDVLLLRGGVAGDPRSRAFLGISKRGVINGHVTLGTGEQFVLSGRAGAAAAGGLRFSVHRAASPGLPDFIEPCGTTEAHGRTAAPQAIAGITVTHGPQIAHLAVDADQEYTQLFPDIASAQDYVLQVVGAISDIYIRDLDVKLILSLVRLWPAGGEPFQATDLAGFANHWLNNEDWTGLNLVHMFSGRRDTGYGGIAYVGGFCGDPTFGISAFFLGSFPSPIDDPDLGNWDVNVTAHEMGHNLGTYHTHDGYTPPIDQCGSGSIWARGEIMSYCHTLAGGLLNLEMRFSTRVQDVIAARVALEGCLPFDCNGNNTDDLADIAGASSADVNANSVPDECEDCNHNGTLDDADIAGGAPDGDGNGVPDVCETNCNGNSLPDEYETANSLTPDANANRVPDSCEPDCDGDNTADFAEIAAVGSTADLNRDGVPDVCVDCNANGLRDWADIARPDFVYIADLADRVRVFHSESGVAETNLGVGTLLDPNDVGFGPDGLLYVASLGNHKVVRIDPDTGAVVDFVPPGSGGLNSPAGLAFRANGNLLVSSRGTNAVLQYDRTTGAFIGAFVSAGAGGLAGPMDLLYGPDGHLYVATTGHSVLRYNGATGTSMGAFVTAGSGGLNGARRMVFRPGDGHLLVASEFSSNVLEYGASGAFVAQFNDIYPIVSPTGLTIGPNGNVYAVSRQSPIRIIEYGIDTGRYIRSFIRGDTNLVTPTSLVFRPATAAADCNANRHPDDCDILEGSSNDINGDRVPDDCQDAAPPNATWAANDAANRFLTIQVGPSATATAFNGQAALKVALIDLQHPDPANVPSQPPPNYTAFDMRVNGLCFGGVVSGHHCDTDADCRVCLGEPRISCAGAADCANVSCPPGGTCAGLVGCSAEPGTLGCARWVGPPQTFLECNDLPNRGSFRGARLQCTPFYTDWTSQGKFSIFGAEIVPSSRYEIQAYAAICKGVEANCLDVLPSVEVTTRRWSDVRAPFQPPGPSTQPDAVDVAALVNKFRNLPGVLPKTSALLQHNVADPIEDVNALDIAATVNAFKGFAYPFSGPCICPSTVTCNTTSCTNASQCTGPHGEGALCVRTCTGGPNAGQPCLEDQSCNYCNGGSFDGLPCDPAAFDPCPGGACPVTGTCGPGFCRDACARCAP